jgi:AhpD family alkylhydroperoxidase
VPNLFATMAGSPEVLAGYLALDGVLAKGTFGAADRQLILTATSAANGCAYCTAAHSTFAAGLRAAPDALAARGAPGTPPTRAPTR